MVIFHGYVSLPEGINSGLIMWKKPIGIDVLAALPESRFPSRQKKCSN